MKYIKKPIIVEAEQWFKVSPYIEGQERVVNYYRNPRIDGLETCKHCSGIMHDHGWIDTLEGGYIVCPKDWIIKGIKGELYPCKPDIFEETYEPAEFADQCLERAEKATAGPWKEQIWTGPIEWPDGIKATICAHGPLHKFTDDNSQAIRDSEFIAHAREDVPELAKRLKRACEVIRKSIDSWHMATDQYKELFDLADELEKIPE